MTTWRDIAAENETAAKELLRARRYRSAISRAYYSAYAAITGKLLASGAVPRSDVQDPSHKALPVMVESNLPGLSKWRRRNLKATTRRLYELRLDADYRGGSCGGSDRGRSQLGRTGHGDADHRRGRAMIATDLKAITRDVSDRLGARQNGVKLRVVEDKTFASDVTVYVFVNVVDGGGTNSLDLLDLFESVERETSKRFNVDVLVLSEPPEIL